MTNPIDSDLNQVIVSAVNARVEAAVAAAMSGDEVMGKYVAAALNQPVEIPDGTSYGKKRVPFLRNVINNAIRDAAKAAVTQVVTEQRPAIEAAVRASIAERLGDLANNLVDGLAKTSASPYSVNVALKFRDQD